MKGGTKLDRYKCKKSVSTKVLDMYFRTPPWLFCGAGPRGLKICNFELNFLRV